MITLRKNTVSFSRCMLKCIDILEFKFILDSTTSNLIKGIVISPENTPIANACIEIIEINPLNGNSRKSIGNAFSDDAGQYAFTLNIKETCDYEFNVYSPL